MAPSSRSPDLPEATPVCAVSGQLRRPRQWSVMSPIRRLHSSRSRKYRSFVDGVVKGANRPFDALQEPPSERQEARESSSWLKAPVAPGESIAGPIGNFRFGRTPGVSQRSPRPLPALSRYHGSGIRCEILTTGGGAPIALLLTAAIRLPPPPRLDPGAARASRSRRPVPAACATCDPRHSGRRRNVHSPKVRVSDTQN
jgi:hypothetical protein